MSAMAESLFATVKDGEGVFEAYEGTQEEIMQWIEERFDIMNVTITVRDELGVTIGHKLPGEPTIRWGMHLSD